MADLGERIHVKMYIEKCCSYKRFQKKLRRLLLTPRAGRAIPRFTYNTPILDLDDRGFVVPSLQYNDNEEDAVRFALRKSDVWLIGFRNGNGRWFEFKTATNENNDQPHMIANSTIIDVLGNYMALEHISSTKVDKVRISPEMMKWYLHTLSNFNGEGVGGAPVKVNADVADALIACIIFIAEGAHFSLIEDKIHHCMCNKRYTSFFTLSKKSVRKYLQGMSNKYDGLKLVRSWSTLSKTLIKSKFSIEFILARSVLKLVSYSRP